MLDIRPVVHLTGLIACFVAAALCLPALADLVYDNPDWKQFTAAALIAGFFGVLATIITRTKEPMELGLRQAFLVTVVGWLVMSFLAAIPFLFIGVPLADAVFESISGVTTTGSTVLSKLDYMPPGILLWRALLQWIGGIGIIAMAILILPVLRVGGMQLFKIESSDVSEKIDSSMFKVIVKLFSIYCGLTGLCGLFYYIFGMSGFDAITHAMTTLSTGGYSTHDASFAYFKDLRLHWTATVFMFASSLPFFLYVRFVQGSFGALIYDQQVRGLLFFLIVSSAVMAAWLSWDKDIGYWKALTLTAFNITSVVTTTGYVSEDYTTWGTGAVGAFLVLMYVGGCSGSTTGAIKIYRYQILYSIVRGYIKRLISPHRVVSLKYNGKPLPDDVAYSILAFLAVFVGTIAVFTVLLTFLGLDLTTAYSATITAISNVGPGLGSVVGPSGNFQPLPDAAKWTLSFAMLAGRLEVLPLLIALDPEFWRF